MTRRIVAISGGLGQPSATRLLVERLGSATLAALGSRGLAAELDIIELRGLGHEIVNAMLTGFPGGELAGALERLGAADGVIAVTPIFTTSYSGLFKSFLDGLDRDLLTGKPVLLGATGGTPRHSLALEYAMRPLFTYLHATVATTAVYAATDDWAGTSQDAQSLPGRISAGGAELATMIAARPAATTPSDEFAEVVSFEDLLRGK
ncbi:MAG: FMN reductase [Candidatus Nanopelagicales bacterium]